MSAKRRRAQAGTTLVELLVSLMIIGLALVFIVGTFSTGLIDATLTKRNTAVEAVAQYELDRISGSQFNPLAPQYSECFATESSTSPTAAGYQGSCPSGPYTVRADVTWTNGPTPNSQVWTITVNTWPNATTATVISTIKVNR